MEHLALIFDAAKFDEAVHGPRVLPDDGQLQVIVKDEGMVSGAACVCLTFGVQPTQTLAELQHLRHLLSQCIDSPGLRSAIEHLSKTLQSLGHQDEHPKLWRAQTVTSLKLLMGALRGLSARYTDRGTRRADDA